jgi:TRAP-type C4-dicarboxylate transport system substrate-binding protein
MCRAAAQNSFSGMNTRIAIGTLLTPLVLVACGGSGDKAGGSTAANARVRINIQSITESPRPVQLWIEAAARDSGGSIQIRPARYHAGDPNAERHLLADLQAGREQLGWVGVRALDRVGAKSLEPLVAPLLIDSYPMLGRVFASGVVAKMVRDVKLPGAVVIGVVPGPFRRVFGVDHPLLSPADYRGAVVGMQDGVLAQRTFELFGATPRAVPAETTLDGLDGYEQQLASIVGNGYDDAPIRVTGNVALWARPIALVASRAWFDRLSDAQRKALRAAVPAAVGRALESTEREDADAIAALCQSAATVVTSSPGQLAELRAAVEPIYQDLAADPATSASFAAISKLKGSDPPAEVPACSSIASPAATATTAPTAADTSELDGEYAATVDASDLPEDQRLPEQYGETRLVIDRGQFRLTHDGDAANWTADGAAGIDGSTLTLGIAHAEDVGPHGAPDGLPVDNGQTLTLGWQRADDGSLQLTADGTLAALTTKPLRRSGRAPGQQRDQDVKALQGTWTGTATADDVRAHHDDETGIHNNTGPMRLTIDGDRFTWTQDTPDRPFTWEGMIVASGDTIGFLTDRTDDPQNGPLPFWVRWSLRHDQLSFRDAPGFSPENWTYHPWQRAK